MKNIFEEYMKCQSLSCYILKDIAETLFDRDFGSLAKLNRVKDHCEKFDHKIKIKNFSILTSCAQNDLRTLESLYIKKLKPTLNIEKSAVPLNLS